jgi:glycerol kinase
LSEPKALLALDQGTTSSRAIVFDRAGTVLGAAQREFPQYFPQPGWVEHDPEDIWSTQVAAARDALAASGLEAGQLAAVGIANQRETALLWDAGTGKTLGNAIVWQCRRTAERCEELRREGLETMVREKTGLRLDPYFSATKFEWLMAAHPEARSLQHEGRLRAGTIDSFLVWRLTGGRRHVTDFTNASRTMLLDLHSLDWDEDLLRLFGIPREALADPIPSAGVVGLTEPEWLGAAVSVAGLAGDQQAALFGQACFDRGDTKNTYGTGCFLLMNVGEKPVLSRSDLIATVAWGLGPGRENVRYALEGSVFAAGAAVQWLRDGLGIIAESGEIGGLAASVADNGGLYFVPALTGLGAPFWDADARGLVIGITRGTTKAHLARAAEEAICCQTRAVLEAMKIDSGAAPPLLKVDGGGAADQFLLQLQADLLGLPVRRHRLLESTAFGAAALAGVAVGFWSLDDVARLAGQKETYRPRMSQPDKDRLHGEWMRAAERSSGWARRDLTAD